MNSELPITAKGEGPEHAFVAIVGEALGREEHEQRRPFVGAAGKLLNAMLAAAQLRREDVYITNVVKVRPPDNKLERLHELGVSVQDYVPMLRTELQGVHPRVVVALGETALSALTGKHSITKWRGSVLQSTLVDGLKVVPTLHPAYVLRDYSMHPVAILDLQRARKESKSRAYEAFQPTLLLNPSLHTVLEYIEKCHEQKTCSFDVETYGPRIRCLGSRPMKKLLSASLLNAVRSTYGLKAMNTPCGKRFAASLLTKPYAKLLRTHSSIFTFWSHKPASQ